MGQMGRVDISGCCETCHSAERYSWGGSLGPCRARLPDGRQALVYCASKKQLLGGEPVTERPGQPFGLYERRRK